MLSFRDMITKRRLLFLGKVIRMHYKIFPAKLISVFLKEKRSLGSINTTTRHTFKNDIKYIIQNINFSRSIQRRLILRMTKSHGIR